MLRELWPAFCETHTGLQKHTGPAQGELLRTAAAFSPSFPLTPPALKNPCCKCNQMLDTISHTLPELLHYQIREGMLPGK